MASKDILSSKEEVRQAVADYIGSEGCSCCRGSKHEAHAKRLAQLLGVPRYRDGSGYNFGKFETQEPQDGK